MITIIKGKCSFRVIFNAGTLNTFVLKIESETWICTKDLSEVFVFLTVLDRRSVVVFGILLDAGTSNSEETESSTNINNSEVGLTFFSTLTDSDRTRSLRCRNRIDLSRTTDEFRTCSRRIDSSSFTNTTNCEETTRSNFCCRCDRFCTRSLDSEGSFKTEYCMLWCLTEPVCTEDVDASLVSGNTSNTRRFVVVCSWSICKVGEEVCSNTEIRRSGVCFRGFPKNLDGLESRNNVLVILCPEGNQTYKSIVDIFWNWSLSDRTVINRSNNSISLKRRSPMRSEVLNDRTTCLLYTSPSPRDRG